MTPRTSQVLYKLLLVVKRVTGAGNPLINTSEGYQPNPICGDDWNELI